MRIWKWFLRNLIIVSRTVKKVQMKRILWLYSELALSGITWIITCIKFGSFPPLKIGNVGNSSWMLLGIYWTHREC